MAFIVETGAGVPDANSYASVADADAYFADRRNEVWAALGTDDKQAALIAATDYMDLRWGPRYIGNKYSDEQGLLWPRILTTLPALYPTNLVRACFEYAVRASQNPLAPDREMDESGRFATVSKEKVGPIEEEKQWQAQNASSNSWVPYTIPDSLMRGLVSVANGGVIR